jgi:hypothetical protein
MFIKDHVVEFGFYVLVAMFASLLFEDPKMYAATLFGLCLCSCMGKLNEILERMEK